MYSRSIELIQNHIYIKLVFQGHAIEINIEMLGESVGGIIISLLANAYRERVRSSCSSSNQKLKFSI